MENLTLTIHFEGNFKTTYQVSSISQAELAVNWWQTEWPQAVIIEKSLVDNKTGKTIW